MISSPCPIRAKTSNNSGLISESTLVARQYLLPHPHNIFVDILRFGGVVGLLFFVFTYVAFLVKGMWAANNSVLAKFCLAWFVGGVADRWSCLRRGGKSKDTSSAGLLLWCRAIALTSVPDWFVALGMHCDKAALANKQCLGRNNA